MNDSICIDIGGHRFEPRYDKRLPDLLKNGNLKVENLQSETAGNVATLMESLKEEIYLYDICVRCGKIVGRKK